ncbi:hypothetical protein V8E54_002552 [Elaphomyces granulatus]
MASSNRLRRRLWYYSLVWQLAFMIAPITQAQGGSPITWTLGMPLQFFITAEETCLQTLNETLSNNTYQTIYYSSNGSLSSGFQIPAMAISYFYLTNGWHTVGTSFDSNAYTSIMLSEGVGNCWSVDPSDTTLIVSSCKSSSAQTFYVDALSPFKPGLIATNDLSVIIGPSQDGDALTVGSSSVYGICIYDINSGYFVVAPSDPTQSHIQTQQITNLTNVLIPGNQQGLPATSLPGCNVGDSFYLTAVDCAIAKAVNGMLPECESNPQASVCIVYLFPAFCGDFSSISAGNNTPDIEYCLRRVGLGPCVANPGGAACLSGQFAGIQFVIGGGSNTGSSKRDNPDPLFGDQGQDLIPLEDQFWVGVMKNFINSGIGLLNWFTDLAAQQLQTACHAATALRDLFNITLRDRMNNGCAEAFKPHQLFRPLEYSNNIEEAGAIFADIILILDGVGEVAEAVKAVTAVDRVVVSFVPKNAPTDLLSQGYYLETSGANGVVRIYRDAGDGSPAALVSDTDRVTLQQSLKESAFDNCKPCIPGKARRETSQIIQTRGNTISSYCCLPLNQFGERPQEDWVSPDGQSSGAAGDPGPSIPPVETSRSIGALTTTPQLSAAESELLGNMRSSFSKFFVGKENIALQTDTITEAFYNARYIQNVNSIQITTKASSMYGLTMSEFTAINTWVEKYMIGDGFVSGLAQFPGTTGLCYRTTDLTSEALNMLKTGAPGVRSKGPPGIYEVQDLLHFDGSFGTPIEDGQIDVMASFLGVMQEFESSSYYRIVINSKTGRYIDPVLTKRPLSEVDFVQGWSQFKLLGWEELNGGEAARLAGKQGPFGIFYLDEIDLGVVQPRICGPTVTTNCRAATLTPPNFGPP